MKRSKTSLKQGASPPKAPKMPIMPDFVPATHETRIYHPWSAAETEYLKDTYLKTGGNLQVAF